MAFNPRRIVGPTSSVDNTVPRFDGTAGSILQNSTNVSISDDGYLGVGNLNPQVHLDVSGALNLRGLAASPPLSPVGQGRVIFDTVSNKFKASENGGPFTNLVLDASANASLSNLSSTSINQSLNPGADRVLDIGTPLLRWRDIYVGPSSLNIVTTAIETGTARNWAIGVSEVLGPTQGRLTFSEGPSEILNISPSGNIGVGVTDAIEKIHTIAGVSNVGLRIDHSSTNPVILQFLSSSSATTITSTFAGANIFKPLLFNVGGSARVAIDTSGSVGIGTVTPTSKLTIQGSISTVISRKTTDYTLTENDSKILVDATLFAVVITLPIASGCPGREYHIKKIDSTTNNMVIATIDNNTIDSESLVVSNIRYRSYTITSDGVDWFLI